jgi:hypothetical protein
VERTVTLNDDQFELIKSALQLAWEEADNDSDAEEISDLTTHLNMTLDK